MRRASRPIGPVAASLLAVLLVGCGQPDSAGVVLVTESAPMGWAERPVAATMSLMGHEDPDRIEVVGNRRGRLGCSIVLAEHRWELEIGPYWLCAELPKPGRGRRLPILRALDRPELDPSYWHRNWGRLPALPRRGSPGSP